MTSGMGKLESLNLFGSNTATAASGEYDTYGYDTSLNVNPADINPEADFNFA